MTPVRKAEQSEATRETLLAIARALFTIRGYAATSIEEIVRQAEVTRGALYYHFNSKQQIFRAVYDDLDRELAEQLAAAGSAEPQTKKRLEVGCQAFLDKCLDPAIQRIVLLDAPSVLGWDEWYSIDAPRSLRLLRAGLRAAMDANYIEPQPAEPLAHLILGALNEAGMAIARADDVPAAREAFGASFARFLAGLGPLP